MATIITGGAGFIGSHVAQRLLEAGEQVVVLDNFNDYYDPQLKRANAKRLQVQGAVIHDTDVRDLDTLQQIFHDHAITHVIHLAAMAGVRASVTQTPLYVAVNYVGTMNVLEVAQEHAVEQVVLASTSSVYGQTKTVPFIEADAADHPLASYPASKRGAEILAHTYHHLQGMNINILRFFNVYGPAGRPDMMPLRLMQAAIDGSTIPIFNNGEIHRDWTYIDDITDGILAANQTPLAYAVMNLGYGSPISLNEFISIIEEYSGRTIITQAVPTPPSDPPITYCDNTRARQLLGFNPQVNIQEGLRRTWDWFASVNK